MGSEKSEVLQGTLDLMTLKTLHALGPQHGFGIAGRIEQVSENVLMLNEGTLYTSLPAITTARLDCGRVRCFREQPPGELLFDYQRRNQAMRA
jgi:hypothetical protein